MTAWPTLPTPLDAGTDDVWGPVINQALTHLHERTVPLFDRGTKDYDFGGASLPVGVSMQGYVSGDLAFAAPRTLVTPKAAGNYLYIDAPVGDFVATMKATCYLPSAAMFGFVVVPASGSGVGAGFYNTSPNAGLSGSISAAGVWNSGSFQAMPNYPLGADLSGGEQVWYRLRRVGTSYYCSLSQDGFQWCTEHAAHVNAATMTRLGVGAFLGTPSAWSIEWLDIN